MTIQLNQHRIDALVLALITAMLVYSLGILLQAHLAGLDIGAWIWARHQHQFSWYSRPLFIIPAAYYAYRRKPLHVLGFIALLATSLFWFDAPTSVSPKISDYLEWEKQLFLANKNKAPLFMLLAAVGLFLFALFYAFWQRNPWYGLWIINLGTFIKIIVSLVFGQHIGLAAIIPSLSSLLVINIIAWIIWRRYR